MLFLLPHCWTVSKSIHKTAVGMLGLVRVGSIQAHALGCTPEAISVGC